MENTLAAENERRSAAEERLTIEMKSSQRLMEEVEVNRDKINLLKEEIKLLRGQRDGDLAAHNATCENLRQQANRERSGREGAEFREEELNRKVSERSEGDSEFALLVAE